jgi:hypothetical protein
MPHSGEGDSQVPGSTFDALRSHAPYLLLLAAAAIGWTWPLAIHFRSHIPGTPGDNFSFVWNLWWMRHALENRAAGFFHSTYLFFPFGVDLVNHPHTALQGLIAATLLARVSVVEAENLYIVLSVCLNAVAAYALAFDLTRQRRPALLAGIAFGGSPYIAAHLYGHFDLLAAWVIPLFAWCFRRASLKGSGKAAVGCGVCVAVAAYSAYYYVVYLALFAVAYSLASLVVEARGGWVERREESTAAFTCRLVAVAGLAADLFLMIWIALTGGTTMRLGAAEVSVRGVQNPLLLMWVLIVVWSVTRWRLRRGLFRSTPEQRWRSVQALTITAAVFAVLAMPLVVQAVRLAISGRYVSQRYFWRSAPRGIDLTSLVMGNPFHPLLGAPIIRAYAAFGLNRIEQVAWIGFVPVLVLLLRRGQWWDPREARRWTIVLGIFLVWALGPFLTVAGRDLGLPLPEMFARFVPLVDNARVPGRAMVVVYLALGVLMAQRLSALRRGAVFEWALIALLAVDYLGAPMPLTALDRPAIYEQLASVRDDSPVIEVPFGIGDGLFAGIGSQDRRVLYYATIHGHPLLGGYIGRMPPGAAQAYAAMPIVGNLLRLSSGQPAAEEPDTAAVPFRYLVLDTETAAPELVIYVRDTLDMDLIGSSNGRELYAVQGVKTPNLHASR